MADNPITRALKRLSASTEELESVERQRLAESTGAARVGDLCDRAFATLRGTITMLTIKPRAGTPWLEAEFNDGSGGVTLIWMGRREIAGISAGRELTVTGRVSCVDGQRRMYNPRYELVAD
jgi:hypothetical protein